MHQNSETNPEQTSAVAPEDPPVATAEPRKRSKPKSSNEPVASAEEAPATDAARPIKTKPSAAGRTAKRRLHPSTNEDFELEVNSIPIAAGRTAVDG